jgi:hypothetical protein
MATDSVKLEYTELDILRNRLKLRDQEIRALNDIIRSYREYTQQIKDSVYDLEGLEDLCDE